MERDLYEGIPPLFRKTLNLVLPELEIHTFSGITSDSRKVQQGDIFLAIKGESTDGHHYIEQAEKAGAAICIVEKEVNKFRSAFEVPSTRQCLNDTAAIYRKNLLCPFIGITGTNGKTTTKDLRLYLYFSQGLFTMVELFVIPIQV